MPVMSGESRQRLSDIAAAWRDARETATVHTRRLEDAVLQACDGGASVREVASVLQVSPQRVYHIIQNAYKR